MSEWRQDFNIIYRLIKTNCSINDCEIAEALNIEVDSVRQYSSNRMTMPDNIDLLCELFETKINNLKEEQKKSLLISIQKETKNAIHDIKIVAIPEYICTLMKKCYINEKSHIPYSTDYPDEAKPTGHIKAIVFDFDGTLTKAKLRTTWESLWEMLGYDVQECRELHEQYDKKLFSHQEWCDKTAEKFIEKQMTRQHLINLSKKIKLIPGCKKTLKELKNRNIKLYIVSGSIKDIIEQVLGDTHNLFTEIKANEFLFDTQTSILTKIIGTKYDFEGKANYINYISQRLGVSTSDILFVGNSNNDTWAYQSGVNTLCVNPRITDYHNNIIWHNSIVDFDDFSKILPHIN